MTFVSAAVWTLIAFFLTLLFLGTTEAAREGAFLDLVSRTACQILAYSIVLFGILRVHEPETSIRHVLGLRPPSVLSLVLALVVGAALALPLEWLDQALEARFPPQAAEKEALERLLSVSTTGKRVALIATLAVLQPAFDELFFRGAIFTPLRRTRRVETVVVATALFETLGNFSSPRAMITTIVASLVFSWLRGITGSIWSSMLARVTYYSIVVVPLALGRDLPKLNKTWLAGCTLAILVGLAGTAVLGRKSTRLLDARLEDGE